MTAPDSSRQPSSWREGFTPEQTGTFNKVELSKDEPTDEKYCQPGIVSDTCKKTFKETQQACLEVIEDVHLPEFAYGDFYFNLKEKLRNHPAILNPDPYDGPLKAYLPGHGVRKIHIGHNGYIRIQDSYKENNFIEPDEEYDEIFFTEKGLELLEWDPEKTPKRATTFKRPRSSGVDLIPAEAIKKAIEEEAYMGAFTGFKHDNPCAVTQSDINHDPTQPLPWSVDKKTN